MSFFNGLNKRPQLQLQPRATPPPVVSPADFVGEVREEADIRYPRNIGCSSTPSGIPLFLSNTFEQNLSFQSLDTPAPLGPHANPLFTSYPSYTLASGEDTGPYAAGFIPFTKEESKYNQSSAMNPRKISGRFYLYTFNTMIMIPGKPDHGVVWFVKEKTSGSKETNKYYGVGVAEVEMKQVVVADAESAEETPVARRYGDVIFDKSSPQWGNVATLLDGDFIYLYSTHNKQNIRLDTHRKTGRKFVGFEENPVFVCRVPHTNKSYLFPERYTYWDGEKFAAAPSKNKGLHLKPVLFDILAGAIFHTPLFSSAEEGLFAMVGCNGSGDGEVKLKIAENPWGPWRSQGWVVDLDWEDRGYGDIKSCVYAYLGASNMNRGKLVFSWSEPWPGGARMVKIGFEMVGDDGEELQQNPDDGDDDSMFSAVEEHLMRAHGGQSLHRGRNSGHDVEQNPDNEERDTARRWALAKLTGDTGSKDYQAYLDDYKTNHDPFVSWGRDTFGNGLSGGSLQTAGAQSTDFGNTSGDLSSYKTESSRGTWFAESHGGVAEFEDTWYHHNSYEGGRSDGRRWEDTGYGDEEPTPLAIVKPLRRLKWGNGLKVDVSSSSKRNEKALQQVNQHIPSHWQPSNRSIAGVDGRVEKRAPVPSGYAGGRYVTEICGSQPSEGSTGSSGETMREAIEHGVEIQQPKSKKPGQWLKRVKKGLRKLMQNNCKK